MLNRAAVYILIFTSWLSPPKEIYPLTNNLCAKDQDKDLSLKDKDKGLAYKDQNKDKDLPIMEKGKDSNFLLKDSLRTRTNKTAYA
jgi:hypothetical protein